MESRISIRRLSAVACGSFALFFIASLVVPGTVEQVRAQLQPPPVPSGPLTPPAVLQSFPAPAIPQLTVQERTSAIGIAEADSRFRQLLGARAYTPATVGVWHTNKLTKLGAGIVFSLAEPASFDFDWLQMAYDQSETTFPPYRTATQKYLAEHVHQIIVLVDFQAGKVVSINPAPGGPIGAAPGTTLRPSGAAGGR